MALNLSFDAALELEWRTLERRLRLLKGFGFIVLFVRDVRLAQGLKVKVLAWLAERHLDWAEVALDTPDGVTHAAQASLSSLFDHMRGGGLHLAWLEAHTRAGQPAWDAERRELLRRLNERRSRLEAELAGAFILLLPDLGVRDIASMAPDLWHVRIHTAELRFDGDTTPVVTAPSLETPQSQPLSVEPSPGLVFWRQQWQAWRAAVGPNLAAVDAALLQQLSLWDGWKAVHECLARGQLHAAAEIALEVLWIARLRLDAIDGAGGAGGASDTTLRDVAIGLEHVGTVAEAATEFETAMDFYTQSVVIHRSLSADTASQTLLQRDLAVGLSNVARMAMRVAQWERAEAASQEALSLFREAMSRSSSPTQARLDLMTALTQLGVIHEDRDDWVQARQCHQEALALARRGLNRDRTSETPSREATHDLLRALNNLTRVVLGQGDWSSAGALAEESQARAREHLQRHPGDARVTLDLMLTLDLTAILARQLGEPGRAEIAERERQSLSQTLDVPTGDNSPHSMALSPNIP